MLPEPLPLPDGSPGAGGEPDLPIFIEIQSSTALIENLKQHQCHVGQTRPACGLHLAHRSPLTSKPLGFVPVDYIAYNPE